MNGEQHGVGMIETLTALLVISIGLLGLARLQQQSLQTLYFSRQTQTASQLLQVMARGARANPAALLEGAYGATGGASCVGAASDCAPTAMARADYQRWVDWAEQQLPSGRVSLDCIGGCRPGGRLWLRVSWLSETASQVECLEADHYCLEWRLDL